MLKRENWFNLSSIPIAYKCSLIHVCDYIMLWLSLRKYRKWAQLDNRLNYLACRPCKCKVLYSLIHTMYYWQLIALNKPNVPGEEHLAASFCINHSLRHFNQVIIHPFCQWLGGFIMYSRYAGLNGTIGIWLESWNVSPHKFRGANTLL